MIHTKSLQNLILFIGVLILNFTILVQGVIADTAAVPAGTAAPAALAGDAAAAQQPGVLGMMMPFLLMFGVIYFMMIRPQQKKFKQQQDMLGKLQHGDEVVTSAGLLGTVRGITDKVVTLELEDSVKVKILKSTVAQVLKGQQIQDLAN